jgi:hypothetical protein
MKGEIVNLKYEHRIVVTVLCDEPPTYRTFAVEVAAFLGMAAAQGALMRSLVGARIEYTATAGSMETVVFLPPETAVVPEPPSPVADEGGGAQVGSKD